MALILITHDMGVVAETARRVSVHYAGQKVEEQAVRSLFAAPHHPYTSALFHSAPRIETGARLEPVEGAPPDLVARPPGCPFHPRCPRAEARCRAERPPLAPVSGAGAVACHFPHDTPEAANA